MLSLTGALPVAANWINVFLEQDNITYPQLEANERLARCNYADPAPAIVRWLKRMDRKVGVLSEWVSHVRAKSERTPCSYLGRVSR